MPRHLPPRAPTPTTWAQFAAVYPVRVVVRVSATAQLPYVDGAEAHFTGADQAEWTAFAGRWPGIALNRLLHSVGAPEIQQRIDVAEQTDPQHDWDALLRLFVIAPPQGANPMDFLADVGLRSWTERAYVDAPGQDPSVYGEVNTTGEDGFVEGQSYFGLAPDGIAIAAAWMQPGGDGASVRVVDVEQGWFLDHDEYRHHGVTVAGGVNVESSWAHGAAVLGLLGAIDDGGAAPTGHGMVGGVPHADGVDAVSYVGASGSAGEHNVANAVLKGVTLLAAGDVLLLETMIANDYPVSTMQGTPVEGLDAVYEVVRLATTLGITVVAAAGNGARDLDTMVDDAGRAVHHPASADFRDSGSVLVGGAFPNDSGSSTPLGRWDYGGSVGSCYGSRVNCFSVGSGVYTTTGSPTSGSDGYVGDFNGTSAAAAIVAAGAAALQGVARTVLGAPLSAETLRGLLTAEHLGTPSLDPANDRIGVMPDLQAILSHDVGASLADVYVRDFVGDVGTPYAASGASDSPDVLIAEAGTVADAATDLSVSASPDGADFAGPLRSDRDYEIFVRVSNRGPGDAQDVGVRVYAAAAGLPLPPASEWVLVGEALVTSVAADADPVVSTAIPLAGADLPGAGEYVFVVLVGHGGDPLPALPDFTAGGLVDAGVAIEHFLQNVNNATRRSVSVVNPVLPVDALWTVDLPFTLEPVPGEEVEVHLDVLPGRGLPAATELRVRTTEGSRLLHARERPAWEEERDGGWTRALAAHRPTRLRLRASGRPASLRLTAELPVRADALVARHGGAPQIDFRLVVDGRAAGSYRARPTPPMKHPVRDDAPVA